MGNIICNILVIIAIAILSFSIFRHVPKRGKKLYSNTIARGGFHIFYPPNTLPAFKAASKAKLAISIGVRRTKDGKLICFHNRYTRKVLGIPGKVNLISYETLQGMTLYNSNEKIALLKEALKIIDGKVPILLEIRGNVKKEYLLELENVISEYNGKVYFETKDIRVYFILRKKYKYKNEKRVYYVFNLFRKRFQCIKEKDYAFQRNKYYTLSKEANLPSTQDITSIIVRSMEELENKKEILATIGKTINRYETRVGKNHWVNNSLWLHRSIVSNKYPEHSKESFEECIKFAKERDVSLTLEFDIMLYKGEVKCYHKDKISSILGQEASCAEKLNIEKTLSLKEILEIVNNNPRINLAIDIKDFHFKDRYFEELIIREIEESRYNGNFILMSFNPMVLNFLKKERPEWLRAQIGHSLRGLRKKVPFFKFPWIINGFLGMVFDVCQADVIVMDDSNWLYGLISFHRNVQGKPVLIYAPKSYREQESFIGRDSIANFIVENIESTEDWPDWYIQKFKYKNTH